MAYRSRFAPSPTGYLHVGNGYSALLCQQWCQQWGGVLVLRIEDIDYSRCRPQFDAALIEDLGWLGLHWQPEVMRQSERIAYYRAALDQLQMQGVLYPCFCSRKSLAAASAPHGVVVQYPGICRQLAKAEQQHRMATEPFAWRLNMRLAAEQIGHQVWWCSVDGVDATAEVDAQDDIVLARKDIGVAYHLAVVVDDAAQGIDVVIRGEDLAPSVPVQRVLQQLLGLSAPRYWHHPLLRDGDGQRLAKRNHSTTLRSLRAQGVAAQQLAAVLLQAPAPPRWDAAVLDQLLSG
ncbi:MAG: tRNA glutamyl-Q(34) synthetase GluQRS [Mariprofundales bacterium]|nr:tRNA glutamyl-Q(34) synthetase GluQRS [Mariprofundales bacterium]